MRKRTTTKKINEALSRNLLQVTKVEIYNKTSRKTDGIDINIFRENLDFLAESGIFADCIGWCYEDNSNDDGQYIVECSRMDASVDAIITVYLRIGKNAGEIDKVLSPVEEE